jgi:hypothetical protein
MFWLLLCQLMMELPAPAPPPPPGAPAQVRTIPQLEFTAAYAGPALELTWRNSGADPLYVQIGTVRGRRASLNITATRADGGQIVDWTAPTVITGRMEPLVLFLTPGSRYTHRIATTMLHDVKAKAKIAQAQGPPPKLRIVFTHSPVSHDDAHRLGLADAGIWIGQLTATTP